MALVPCRTLAAHDSKDRERGDEIRGVEQQHAESTR